MNKKIYSYHIGLEMILVGLSWHGVFDFLTILMLEKETDSLSS